MDTYGGPLRVRQASTAPVAGGVDRVFGNCGLHGQYQLPVGSVEAGDIPRGCPACHMPPGQVEYFDDDMDHGA